MELKVKVKNFKVISHSLAIIVQALLTMMKACIITCTTLMTLAHPAWKIYSCTVVLVLPSLRSEQVCSLKRRDEAFSFSTFLQHESINTSDGLNQLKILSKNPKGLIGTGALKVERGSIPWEEKSYT